MSDNVGKILGKPREAKTFKEDERWVLPKSLIGMEFEYEGVLNPDKFYQADGVLPHYWEVHKDDSLKDHGMEFVFRTPLFGADAYTAIEQLMERAKAANFKCSVRAGIHVHADVRDLESSQLIGFIILYTIVEPILFKWIGDNRENSIFCVPFYRADDSLQEVVSVVKSIIQDEAFKTKNTYSASKNFARYAALNLAALAKFGSVEFRHMKATHDKQRVIDWVNIIHCLKAATFKFPTSDGAILNLARNTAINAFLVEIFGYELARKLWTDDAHELVHKIGLPTARDLVSQGLSEHDWAEVFVPAGHNRGFAKYIENLKAAKGLNEEQLIRQQQEAAQDEIDREREARQLREADRAEARRVRLPVLGDRLVEGWAEPNAPRPAVDPLAEPEAPDAGARYRWPAPDHVALQADLAALAANIPNYPGRDRAVAAVRAEQAEEMRRRAEENLRLRQQAQQLDLAMNQLVPPPPRR